MSKKITDNDIKKLIEEVLNEEQLNEREAAISRIGKNKNISKAKAHWGGKGWKGPADGEWDAKTGKPFIASDFKKGGNIDKASSQDGTDSDLSGDDLKAYKSSNNAFFNRAMKSAPADVQAVATSTITPPPGPPPGPPPSGGGTGANVAVGQLGAADVADKSLDADQRRSAQPFGAMDFDIARDTRDVSLPKNPTMKDILNKAKAQISKSKFERSLVDQMGVFTGTIEERLLELEKTAATIESGNFAGSDTDALEFTVKANVLTSLTNIAKINGPSSAGFAFEEFCIAFFSGIGAGGANGAIDGILKSNTGGIIPSSQKLLTGGKVEQSFGGTAKNKIGLYDYFKEGMKDILYFVGQKLKSNRAAAGTPSNYELLEIHVLKLSDDGSISILEIDSAGDGTWQNTGVTFNPNQKGKSDTIINWNDIKSSGVITCRLPVLSAASSDPTAIAEYVSKQLSSGPQANVFKTVESVYQRLINMRRNTQSYASTGGSGKSASGEKAKDYLNQIATDYMDIKDEYKTIGTLGSKSLTGKAKTAFNEGKKVTSDYLKKIIAESFKK